MDSITYAILAAAFMDSSLDSSHLLFFYMYLELVKPFRHIKTLF